VLLGVLVAVVLVFGSDDDQPSASDVREALEDVEDDSDGNPPAPASVPLQRVFSTPGYTFIDLPEGTAEARAAIAAEVPDDPAFLEDVAVGLARKDGTPVGTVTAALLKGVQHAPRSVVTEGYLAGGEAEMDTHERITVAGHDAVFGTDEGLDVVLAYKNGVGLAVVGSGRPVLEALTADLLVQIP
jgi:hypothetical protein